MPIKVPIKVKENVDADTLREKLRLKSIDCRREKEQQGQVLEEHMLRRNALRIGNDCLRHMTRRQHQMPLEMNAKIFSERPREERVTMKRLGLSASVLKNDGILFRYGKRMMKQEQARHKAEQAKEDKKKQLEEAKAEQKYLIDQRNKECNIYLHKQVCADSYKSRQNSAKLIYQRLQKILIELERTCSDCPCMIQALEIKINHRKRELDEFQSLRNKAKKLVALEKRELRPLNKGLTTATIHFEKAISQEKAEIEERKKNPLSVFLAERELKAFNYRSGSNIEEIKMKARDQSWTNAQEHVTILMDAMLISDIKYVIDCIIDQEDVTQILERERNFVLLECNRLQCELERIKRVRDFLRYNNKHHVKVIKELAKVKSTEAEERTKFEELDTVRKKQDRLISDICSAQHAMFDKLKPIKPVDQPVPHMTYRWNINEDVLTIIDKIKKMQELLIDRLVFVSRVKPSQLTAFKEARLPPDSVRVDVLGQSARPIQGFDSYEHDQPGYVTREMLKLKAMEAATPKKKKD